MDYVLALGIGFGLALFFGAGVLVNHGIESWAYRKRVCSIVTADDHRNEGSRLLYEALHFGGPDPERRYERYLRNEAFRHFQQADILENGPYKG